MKLSSVAAFLCASLVLGGCLSPSAVRSVVDVSIVNASSTDIEEAQVRFGENVCSWGYIGRTFKAVYGLYPNPITVEAELRWRAGGQLKSKHLALGAAWPNRRSGELLFTVFDTREEVAFHERH